MTDFQKQTLKDVVQTAGIAIGTVSAAFGIIILMAISPYSGFAIVGAFVLYLIIRHLIIPMVQDWKLRGKLTEREYSVYQSFLRYIAIMNEQRAKETVCAFHKMMMDELDNILEKARETIRAFNGKYFITESKSF